MPLCLQCNIYSLLFIQLIFHISAPMKNIIELPVLVYAFIPFYS